MSVNNYVEELIYLANATSVRIGHWADSANRIAVASRSRHADNTVRCDKNAADDVDCFASVRALVAGLRESVII